MTKTLHSAKHRRLVELLIEQRKVAGLTQADVAKALNRHQLHIANIKSGERRVDVVEFLELAQVTGFEPNAILNALLETAD
ncbi:HTH-type transcriptional regulator/antitoxin HipB [Rhizobium soli]|uniref:HTH-type transcriptional regulator/antitoxin HipB n=1 Tax=Rhizobium soli TaxID=424798 RepID=A0A7X0MU59_9HYPH|nr:helix-turn-helix transcriptional regulator [Rhizobium soli]MBB6511171.1 HTH-type transcriptional regulator/antitoxin HipB [Rhizobium soli]